MNPIKLTPDLSVSAQITPEDLKEAAAAGFKSFINNRPDGEAPDQPRNDELAAAAQRLRLEYRAIPIVPGQMSDDQVAAFGTALTEMKGPILAFCRTGTRSTTIWALASAGDMPAETILKTAAAAGYNLDALRPRLEAAFRK